MEVRAHSKCSSGSCVLIWADIKKSGNWYGGDCFSQAGTCGQAFSPWFVYSYPVTVKTSHGYRGQGDLFYHSDSIAKNVYYP